jgi:hypothetical protein
MRPTADIDSMEIRWNPIAKVFLVDFGNIHFAVSRTAAFLLSDGLREAVRGVTHGKSSIQNDEQ